MAIGVLSSAVSDQDFVRGYVAALAELSKPRSMERAAIICSDAEGSARATLQDADWVDALIDENDDRDEVVPSQPPSPPRNGTVYVFHDTARGLVKIGWTSDDVERRRLALEKAGGCDLVLLHTQPGTMLDERAIHASAEHLRVKGEWFVASPETMFFA